MGVGVGKLLLHLGCIGVELNGDTRLTGTRYEGKAVSSLLLAEVDKQHAGALCGLGGEEVELRENVVDTVGAEGDAHAADAWEAKDACEVVVASPA